MTTAHVPGERGKIVAAYRSGFLVVVFFVAGDNLLVVYGGLLMYVLFQEIDDLFI